MITTQSKNSQFVINNNNNKTNEMIPSSTSNNSTSSSMPITPTERLIKVLNENTRLLCPMVSLPYNDNYWCEGWKNTLSYRQQLNLNESLTQHDDLIISSSSLSSPLSSASSSPSPSPSNQSSNSNKIHHHHHDYDTNNEQSYRDSFMNKEHLNFYGQDVNNSPFILSYKIEQIEYTEFLRAILRTRENNYYATIPLSLFDEPVIPQKIFKTINPDYKPKFVLPMTHLNVSFDVL